MLTSTATPVQAATVVAGVDTHKDSHYAAVLDLAGHVLGDRQFPVSTAGYRDLLDWAGSFGVLDRVGVELTGSYGAGLTRFLTAEGLEVLEVNTTDKATRARRGKSDLIDAIAAAQKVLSGMATAVPKDTTGPAEAVRMVKLARDSAVACRTKALNQIRDLRITAPAALREQLDGMTLPAIARLARNYTTGTGPDALADPEQAAMRTLRRLGTRVGQLDEEIKEATAELDALVASLAPTLIARPGIGTHTAAQFIVTCGTNLHRIRTDAAFARICGAAPVPVSSGKTTRMRLHRGGDRQANKALHMIVVGRMRNHQPTLDYIAEYTATGKSKRDAMRSLKRYVAREVFNALKSDQPVT